MSQSSLLFTTPTSTELVEMTKIEMFKKFNCHITKSSIVVGDSEDETKVFGKFCIIGEPIDETGDFDFFICNPKNMHDGLGTGKVNNIIDMIFEKIEEITEKEVVRHNGEASVRVNESLMHKVDRELLRKMGVKLKPRFSEETKRAGAERLASSRANRVRPLPHGSPDPHRQKGTVAS